MVYKIKQYLPQKEVAEPDLPRGPNQQVRVGGLRGVETLFH